MLTGRAKSYLLTFDTLGRLVSIGLCCVAFCSACANLSLLSVRSYVYAEWLERGRAKWHLAHNGQLGQLC